MAVPRRRALWLVRVALSLAATLAGPAGSANAADPTENPLAGPFVDVAVIAAADGSAGAPGPPRLLAVRPPDVAAPGTVHVVLLGPDGGRWTTLALTDIETELAHAGPARLIPVDDGFALVTVDQAAERTFVQLLTPGVAAITGGASVLTNLGEGGAGAADVDGDGNRELVLTGRSSVLRPIDCGGSLLEVLDGHSLAPRQTVRLAGLDLYGGAIGRLGGPGQDLIAYAHAPCHAAPRTAGDPLLVVGLRIGSSRIVLEPAPKATGITPVGPWIPFLADLDGDGVDEVIARQGGRTVVVDPGQDWRVDLLAVDAMPLAVTRLPEQHTVVALYRPVTALGDPTIDLVELSRTRPGGPLTHQERSSMAIGRPVGSMSITLPEVELAIDPGAPPPAWIGDLHGSGCLDAVLPRATFERCPSEDADWAPQVGPAWTMTAPLTAYYSAGGRRLLVAAGLAWSNGSGSLAVPAPLAAAGVAGGWRSAPSSPFALEELDAGDIRYFGTYPRPIVDIDPNVSDRDAPGMILGGTAGDRVFIRLTPESPTDAATPLGALPRSADDAVTAGRYLVDPPPDGYGRVAFMPVTSARTAGATRGSVWVALPQPGEPAASVPAGERGNAQAEPTLAAAWRVEALGVNGYGEVSEISIGRVAVDRAGPNVSVDAPFVSAPWPFSAPIQGTTERGSRVRLGGGPFIDTASNGAFVLRAQLAPWPQDVVIEAIDARGNISSQTLSVVGGVDYRRLPWQAVVITAVLLGAAITTWRGPAAVRRDETARAAAGAYPGGSRGILDGATTRANQRARVGAAVEEKGEIEDLPAPPRARRG